MDEELKVFLAVWIWTFAALYYCYSAVSQIPKGTMRLLALLPIFFFLTVLPLKLSSFHLGLLAVTSLTWLCNFKVLLFAFDKGPLAESRNLLHFISVACLPVKPQSPADRTHAQSRDALVMPRNVLLAIKVVLLALIFKAYAYRPLMHPYLASALYCVQVYLQAELLMAIFVIPARALIGPELDPQFNEPYLATSLQDFWGHRWNLFVSGLLRATVYHPARSLFAPVTGHKFASPLAMIATFTVSGLMHELIYYYVSRVRPTWEVTWFFVLQGVCVVAEVAAKRSLGRWWRLHRAVSGPLTVAFVMVTSVWLFLPQVTRNGVDDKAMEELYGLLCSGKESFSAFAKLGKSTSM
ncbi:long-chain-alcohol O-fatty-acyltransferase-like [Punica granatum]|uniref:Wax synthase domain-containing protein n=2 Tax=Punica granatum TaxID=22663 RepID=A0A218X9D6_PUNGR|nr:long-chain-alcohol O-fatty-acyltransferase-like [Punica granatum]OWM81330.1 hypothetical protein CDL15_Pgr007368 [Punica granatum]PKI36321.1 hypothetical protein CRG98_043286 [Punica granatum]